MPRRSSRDKRTPTAIDIDRIAGEPYFHAIARDEEVEVFGITGALALFRNFDETTGNPLPRPNTLLIDSEQLESGSYSLRVRRQSSDEEPLEFTFIKP